MKNEIEEIIEVIRKREVRFLRFQFVDILGIPKGIVVPANKAEEVAGKFDDR